MSGSEIRSHQGRAAHRGAYTVLGATLALFIAACGSEAENADTAAATQQPAAQTEQSTGEAAQAGSDASTADSAAETDGGSDAAMTADAGDVADGGGQEAAVKKEMPEEKKREPMDGYTVYNRFCATCHRTGLNAAPKHRDKKAWAPRIAKGRETLYKHSIEGFKGMPPKGGIAGLYDQEVRDAVDFMVEQAGGWDAGE